MRYRLKRRNWHSFLASASTSFCLFFPACFLHPVLAVLLCTTSDLSLGGREASPHQTVLWLKLLHFFLVLVDQAKTRAAAATERCFEAEELNAVGIVHLVHRGQFLC